MFHNTLSGNKKRYHDFPLQQCNLSLKDTHFKGDKIAFKMSYDK